jgi:hypothetical protein
LSPSRAAEHASCPGGLSLHGRTIERAVLCGTADGGQREVATLTVLPWSVPGRRGLGRREVRNAGRVELDGDDVEPRAA